jgi:hypothetical protein
MQGRPEEKRAAILQSNYIPWKGYFDIIGLVDVFVIYDDVQYSKNHWHNRNLIKTQHGLKWLTVPVSKADGAFPSIDAVRIASPFAESHRRSILQAYSKATHYDAFAPMLSALYEEAQHCGLLTELNLMFIRAIAARLGIATEIIRSRDLGVSGERSQRLVSICETVGAKTYLSGPSAQAYLDERLFEEADIRVEWMDYSGYPPYEQLHGPFAHGVSIIDLIMNQGPQAASLMKFSRRYGTKDAA